MDGLMVIFYTIQAALSRKTISIASQSLSLRSLKKQKVNNFPEEWDSRILVYI